MERGSRGRGKRDEDKFANVFPLKDSHFDKGVDKCKRSLRRFGECIPFIAEEEEAEA